MKSRKNFWITLCFLNLAVVALFGAIMRSKILFSIPFIDYRSILSAHSHFAFGGWVGLALITLLIYQLLPLHIAEKKIYQWILLGIEVSSVGMALTFPFIGYAFPSIFFSTLYILVSYVFGWTFFKDILLLKGEKVIRWLALSSVGSLILSSIGPFGLSYILITKSSNALLYRDSVYTFLHFQYNGFFALAVFAIFFSLLVKKGMYLNAPVKRFAIFLCLSIVPSVFLALLWHNQIIFYVLAAVGCLLIFISLVLFLPVYKLSIKARLFSHPLARAFWIISFLSFGIKMLLTIGTIYPPLGNAVYGARPVIIGFLHLVFLAFVTFYIFSHVIEEGAFNRKGKLIALPFYIFGFGVIANEVLLMVQGLEILLKTNNPIYNQFLWVASILLVIGALLIAFVRLRIGNLSQEKSQR
jgi:hypothetical protein